jgi:alpha-tubulin suppressor-like RCC1 family protein
LAITVSAAGNVKVKINRAGIEETEKAVAVYKAGTSTTITWTAQTDGAAGTTTSTKVDFVFSGAVAELTPADITLADNGGSATKGEITRTDDTHWNLAITVTTAGNVKVKINKTGIEATERDVAVHKAKTPAAITWTAQVDGAVGTTTSTKVDFEFSGAVTELSADNITITGNGGSVTKGTLTKTDNTHWALEITVVTEGNVTVSISKTGIETSERDVAVYKAEPPVFPEITPFPIASSSYSSSAASSGATLLLKNDGTVWATGNNRRGQFGNGTTIGASPYTTTTFTQVADHVVAVADSVQDTYIIKDDGSLWAAGYNNSNAHTSNTSTFERVYPAGVDSAVKVKAVSVNEGILVLMENGEVYAKGTNANGQLGTGTTATVTEWTRVATDVKAIAKNQYFSLILKNNGEVWGAGKNYFNALGLGPDSNFTYTDYPTFRKVFDNAAAIAVGSTHSLILKRDGNLWGAGAPYYGKLGNGNIGNTSSSNPSGDIFTQIYDSNGNPISGVSAISAGDRHSLMLKDGSVWGAGELNFDFHDGDNGASVGWFTRMVDSGVTKISAQGRQSFIIKADGTLWVSGLVNIGILGNTAQTKTMAFTQITMPMPE